MKKLLFILAFVCGGISLNVKAQALFAPVTTTNYNFDAVAETSPSSVTTSGAIDGSNYVMHSMAYANMFSQSVGLPNSGLVSVANRTYQMQPYNQNNMLYAAAAQIDSIIFVNPSPYNALSLMGLATEGTGTMVVTVRFTDNTTQVFSNVIVADWFNGANNILNSFGRTNRTSGAISNPLNAPNFYTYDFNLTCANRLKNVKNIKISNIGTNPRLCFMAVSGASNASTITATSNPVTCQGGTNGSASVSATGGTPPFTYSWSTTPSQSGSLASNLPIGTYSYTVTDAGGCPVSGTVAVTQSLMPQPSLFMSSNGTLVCLGNTVAIAASGANTFTWSTGATQQLITVSPSANTTYTVGGYTSANCFLTGSIAIAVSPLPTVSITALPASLCIDSPTIAYTYGPSGGTLTAPGFTPGVFEPNVAGVGLATISYVYTDANNCSASASATTQINPLPVVSVSLTTTVFCNSSPAFTLTGSGAPAGGNYSGSGVSGSVFSPATAGAGTANVIYTYTDSNGCASADTAAVQVYSLAAPSLSVAKTFFCSNAPNVQLISSPGGGAFSGTAMSPLGLFSPTAAGVGTYSLSYSITSGVCTSAKTITVEVSACAGLNEQEAALFALFPNPNSGSFTIRTDAGVSLAIYNQLGQQVVKDLAPSQAGEVKVESLPAGVYYIVATSGARSSSGRIIVTK